MPPSRISARVIGFIADKIDTVAELETLLILSDDELRSWSAQDLAARLYIEPAKAATILNTLVRRRLVIVAETPPCFRFGPAQDEDRDAFAEVNQSYRRNLVAITTLIHSKASTPVKEFARAFDLKKDPE